MKLETENLAPYTVRELYGRSIGVYVNVVLDGELHLLHHSYSVSRKPNSDGYIMSAIAPDDHPVAVPLKFGSFQECAEVIWQGSDGNRASELFTSVLKGTLRTVGYIHNEMPDETCLHNVIEYIYYAEFVEGKEGFVSLYKTAKDFARARKTEMKLGRALLWMFPGLSCSYLELIVKGIQDYNADREYVLHIGESREDFKHSYSDNLSRSFNPRQTSSRKSLHSSCMRGVLSNSGISPAEVYASGDFEVFWVECKEGRIAGRVVVMKTKGDTQAQAGPIYGVCEQSIDLLDELLVKYSVVRYDDDSSWDGAKILRLEDGGGIIAPYSDMTAYADQLDSKFFVLQSHGDDIELDSTNGYASDKHSDCCESCGAGFDMEHGGAYIDNDGCICEYCLDSHYVFAADTEDYTPISDAIEVFYKNRFGSIQSETHSCDSDEAIWCECVCQFWQVDQVTFSEKYEEYVPDHLVGDHPEMFEEEKEEETA